VERISTLLSINKLLTVLKGLSHLLGNDGTVCGMVEQRHGLLASITIKLPFILTVLWKCGPPGEPSIELFGGSADPRRIILWTVFRCYEMYPGLLAAS